MIRENCVGANVNGKYVGQQRDPILDVLLPRRVVLPGQRINAAQKVPADATGDDVIERRDLCGHQAFSGLRHGLLVRMVLEPSVAACAREENRQIGRIWVGKSPVVCLSWLSVLAFWLSREVT